ncbi:MAG TPA: M56 family metallopeptidase [Longimicrobiales bacterium]|nr:M56 family metallopeptidase [Longimicrobiales bacterium]
MILVQAFLRGAIVFLIAGLLTVVLQNRSAAVRHHIWASAIVIQLAILAFIPILPPISLPIVPTITAFTDAPVSRVEENTPTGEQAVALQDRPIAESPANLRTLDRPKPTDWKSIIFYTWLIGATLVLLRYIVGTLLMARIASQGKRVEEGEWLTLAQKIGKELQITRPVTLLWGGKLSIPITWGVLYPMILLPESAMEWPVERRRFVLVHEMAHVKRFDALTQLVAQLTLAVFWFSPFVWLSEWRLRVEREHACDDVVLHHGTEAALYADELLQMVRSLVSRKTARPAFAALAMARRSEFEGRMLAILDPARRRGTSTITSSIVFIALSLLIAAPLAAIDPFAVNIHFVDDAPVAKAKPPQPKTVAGLVPLKCETGKGTSTSTHINVDDQTPPTWDIEVTLSRPNRCVAAEIQGKFVLSDDDMIIEELSPRSYIQLREVTAANDIEVRVTPTATGLHTDISNTGSGPMNSAILHQWIGRVLPEVMREAAVQPEARVNRMFKAHGLRGTIETINAIGSPSSRRMHYVALAQLRRWDDEELTQIQRAATTNLGSSDLKAFIAEAPRWTRPEKTLEKSNDWLEEGFNSFTSSNDLRVALSAHLPDADKKKLLMMMRVSQKMQSSYDLTTFLTAATSFVLTKRDAELEDAWFDALSKSSSSYDRSNALMAAISYAYGNTRLKNKIGEASASLTGTDKTNIITALAAVR